MNRLLIGFILSLALSSYATETRKILLDIGSIETKAVSAKKFGAFSKISISGIENSKEVGAPELPVKSWLLEGTPANLQIKLNVKKVEILAGLRPVPVQPQDCRCEVKKVEFQFNESKYQEPRSAFTLTYLGAFRGTPITRLDVSLGQFDSANNTTTLKTDVDVQWNTREYNFRSGDNRDYLLIVPTQFIDGINEFVQWKKSQGYNVIVEELLSPANNLNSLSAIIKKHYQEDGTDFVMLFGDDSVIPMFKVDTSGSYNTPTDLKHFLMDGAQDKIPDMFYSRISASTVDQVRAQLAKSIEFEQKSFQAQDGMHRIVGIASNEGSSPSDAQYIKSIEEKFVSTLGVEATYLHQDDAQNSNPTMLNSKLNDGAFWLTYLGHGSGTSWPSFNQAYTVAHVQKLNNKPAVKPIIIDVACMNGRISQGYLGTTFMKAETQGEENHFGAVAYYGGTVNISWHPPAIMARGIAFEQMKNNFKHLGEALLAGQIYLAANWNSDSEVMDNLEWYHLQGDPGLNIEFNK
jgi:hypothetical protein